jgi:hypothetical protein
MPVPDWRKWRDAHEVELREAIALSLNLAPEKVFYDGEEGREYDLRLFVARRNLSSIGIIRAFGAEAAIVWVALPRFAAWAQSLGWRLPIELVEIIDAHELGAALPTGMAGRPSKGKDLIAAEFHRRVLNNACKLVLKEEAEALRQWYQAEHPTAAQPTVKTIENNIRDEHRQWVVTRPPETS